MDLTAFARNVGTEGPVTCVGGRTQWDVGGAVDPLAREVTAPVGILEVLPDEMTVRCGAGTTVADLQQTLADVGQHVSLDGAGGATLGGVLAVGRSGIRRLGHGPVRDAVLEARLVLADGEVVKAGGPTVKNVSGFDLCRLLVGSLGTLGFFGEVLLRTRPLPARQAWFAGLFDPFDALASLDRPASILWDGTTTWVCLEGHPADVSAQAARLEGAVEVEGPPELPAGGRASLEPRALRTLTGPFVAEVGVGVVHLDAPSPPRALDPVLVDLQRRVRHQFDPAGRLNPGRSPW